MNKPAYLLNNANDTKKLAHQMIEAINQHTSGVFWVHLVGAMGVGKTALVRFFLQACGYAQIVKSPTYTLMEIYDLPHPRICRALHFDFYRLSKQESSEFLAIEEHFKTPVSVCFVEWPQRVNDLPKPWLTLEFSYHQTHEMARCVLSNRAFNLPLNN